MRARRVTVAVLAALVLATIGICQVEATTLTHENGDMYLGFGLPVVWAFVIAGLIALRRRPGNRTGWLMIGIGFGWLCSALTDSRRDVVFTLGMLLSNIWPGLMVHRLLSYPSGTLDRRSRIIVTAGYAITLGVGLLLVPFSQPRTDGLAASPRSADNLLLVSHQTTLINVVQVIAFAIAVAVLAASLVVLAQRWRAATPAMRRVLAPMYVTGATAIGVTLLVVAILQIAHVVGNMLSFYVTPNREGIPQFLTYSMMALAAMSVVAARRPRGALIALGLTGLVLALGPFMFVPGLKDPVPMPYRWLAAVVPGFAAMRAPQACSTV